MRRIMIALALALLLPGAAFGAATPLAPAPGATVADSHPELSWSVPASEESSGIYVASSPATLPDGQFPAESVVDSEVFFEDETSWATDRALRPGQYWWTVWTRDRSSMASLYSPPQSFTVSAPVAIVSLRVRRYPRVDKLRIDVRWTGAAGEARVTARLRLGSRTVWSKSSIESSVVAGITYLTLFEGITPPGIGQGTRLRLEVIVRSGGGRASVARTVRAP